MLFWFHCQNNITKRKLVHFWLKRRFCSCSKQHKYRKKREKTCFWREFAHFYVRNRWVVLFWIQKCKNLKIENFAVMGFWDAGRDITHWNKKNAGKFRFYLPRHGIILEKKSPFLLLAHFPSSDDHKIFFKKK